MRSKFEIEQEITLVSLDISNHAEQRSKHDKMQRIAGKRLQALNTELLAIFRSGDPAEPSPNSVPRKK